MEYFGNFISKSSKIEFTLFDENTSMEIFFKHVFKDGSFYILHLYEFSEEVFKAYARHPITSKIIGSSLNRQARLHV